MKLSYLNSKGISALPVLVVMAILVAAFLGFLMVKERTNPSPSPIPDDLGSRLIPDPKPKPSEVALASCVSTDTSFCTLAKGVKTLVDAGKISELADLHKSSMHTCNSTDVYQFDVCKGVKDGVEVVVYSTGWNAGEGALYSKAGFIAAIEKYVSDSGPFAYSESSSDASKGVIKFLNPKKDMIFDLNAEKVNEKWVLTYPLMGLNLEAY